MRTWISALIALLLLCGTALADEVYISDQGAPHVGYCQDNGLIGGTTNGVYNYGAATDIASGQGPSSANAWRTPIFRFGLSSVPSGSDVTAVTFGFRVTGVTGSGVTVEAYQIEAANDGWVEGTANGATQVGSSCNDDHTYQNQVEWTNGAQWFNPGNYINTLFGTADCTTTGAKTISFNASGVAAVEAAIADGDFEVCLIGNFVTYNNRSVMASSENATTAYRPYLYVVYTPPVGAAVSQVISVTFDDF